MFKITIAILALFISAMLMEACGSTTKSFEPSNNQASNANATQPQFITGAYTTQLKFREVHPELGIDIRPAGLYLGKWNLNFGEQSQFTLSQGSQEIITGTYSVASNTISFSGKAWEPYCYGTPGAEEVSYLWESTGSNLSLYPKEETCAFRMAILSTHALTFSGVANNRAWQMAYRVASSF
jgi:hypothetical protein